MREPIGRMAVYRTQQLHDVERTEKRFRQHGSHEVAPGTDLLEDQVDPLRATGGKSPKGFERLLGAVVLQDLLEHDVVEGALLFEQIPEVRHDIGRSPSSRSFASF